MNLPSYALAALLVISLLGTADGVAQHAMKTGTIQGRLVDAATRAPLIGANVMIAQTQMGAASASDGAFAIERVPAGGYTLHFRYIGYEPLSKTDIIVRPGRVTFVEAALKMAAIEVEEVLVRSGHFVASDEQAVSQTSFSHEEIRRAPGAAGDVSRIMMALPGVASINDQSNSLVVRGGSPVENAFFVDNIEIPNINHFPTQGASGGPIGLIHVDFIRDVDFAAGGFGAGYGDRLSSVLAISFREGMRQRHAAQLDLNFAGFGGLVEGPLISQKGSYLFAVRRSYLDVLIKAIDTGTSVAPRYGDLQGKLVYDLSPRHQLSLLAIWGDDHNNPDAEAAEQNDMLTYGNQDIVEGTTGLNWRALWGDNAYSETSLALNSTRFDEDHFETNSGLQLVRNRSLEQHLRLRNLNFIRLSRRHAIEFGANLDALRAAYDNAYAAGTDALGNPAPALLVDHTLRGHKLGLFAIYHAKLMPDLSTSFGMRADYFSHGDKLTVSPRAGFSYQLTERTSFDGAAGIYRQSLPLLLLAQNRQGAELPDLRAVHWVLGLKHLLTEDTRLTLELYRKDYDFFPINPAQPSLFLIDELFYRYGFFLGHEQLRASGVARSQGVEVMLQKKLATTIHGIVSASYFTSRYHSGDGIWRKRVFENGLIFSVQGGYRPSKNWELGLRWIYAGGPPYTPLDVPASQGLGRAVLDSSRVNAARFPAYHSLNLRIDRRFHFAGSSLVAYLSIWNAYNRKNIASYTWSEKERRQKAIYQWGILPIFGLEFEL